MKKSKYELIIDLPAHNLKKGDIFEWDSNEFCYITKSLPWMFTPLINDDEIKDKKVFKKI